MVGLVSFVVVVCVVGVVGVVNVVVAVGVRIVWMVEMVGWCRLFPAYVFLGSGGHRVGTMGGFRLLF